MDVHEVLVAARNLIDREGWRGGHGLFADDGHGPNGERCVGIACRDGADHDVNLWAKACRLLAEQVGATLISSWNDTPGRTKEEVLAAFDKAIAATAPEPHVELEVAEEVVA